jgi:class 3 adenylate cyclase/tetratricopeptide (TPR) repeat protein
MSNLLSTIAAYVPPNIVRSVLTETSPEPPSEATVERFPAAVLFADVSGFTPLTEALAQKGSEGPEELTRLLNRYFSWMIAFIEVEGGEVVKFGGDALTAVFPAVEKELSLATRRAMQAAETMQSVMDEFNVLESSAGLVTLTMKIGIGVGEILAAHVGGYANRWEYIIAGDPLRQVGQAERQARQGQIVLSPEAGVIIAPDTLPARSLPRPDWASARDPAAAETVLRCYVPKPVLAWLDEELHSWLATLRPMSVLFVGIKGLDYEQANAIHRLHAFLRGAQEIIYHYQGCLPRLTVDDKGTVLLILFGAPPYAHEDDPERALRCALDLQALAEAHNLQLTIGLTTGRVFAGPVGGHTRREYTVMGDTVNLAARLMTVAEPGQIYCNYDTYRSTRGQISFEHLPPVRLKGKAGLIRLYRPIAGHRPTGQINQVSQIENEGPVSAGELVGRQAEMARLTACLAEVQAGRGRIVIIEGEAGIGKSRLTEALRQLMLERGLAPLLSQGRSIEQETPYHAWRDIFYAYFGLEDIRTGEQAERQHRIQTRLDEVAPELSQYLPLLNDVLNLGLPENASTAALDTMSRRKKLVSLLLTLLRAWAIEKPLPFILEDAHWLDPSSWDLVIQAARALVEDQLPLFLVIVMRPVVGGTMRVEPLMLTGMAETEHLHLDFLSSEQILALAAARLGLTGNELPEAVAELVQRRAGGNPFFAEELIYALHDNGFITLKTIRIPNGTAGKKRCLISGDLEGAAQILPATIQSTVLARIDRLPPEEQLMLRVAAVIGHTFAYTTLRDTLSHHLEVNERQLNAHLYDLVYLDLIEQATPEPDLNYRFKHSIIREVTYQSVLFDQRRRLHRTVAEWYEHTFHDVYPDGDGRHGPPQPTELPPTFKSEVSPTRSADTLSPTPLAPYYPLLVYHWHQAEDEERERHYAALVAEQTVAQFANAEALGYLNRALDLTPETDLLERYKLLLARETVYDRRGSREAQTQDLVALADLAKKMEDERREIEVTLRQAHYAEVTGDYTVALSAAQQALVQTKRIQDPVNEIKSYIAWGRALWPQGYYEAAKDMLGRALALARISHNRHGEAESLGNLGVVYRLQGNYSIARTYCQEALTICRANGYDTIEADSLNTLGLIQYHLGDYAAARDYFDQAIPLYYTIGDQRGELKSFHNIGLIYLRLGDYGAARDYFEQTQDIGREIGDRETVAEALSNLGVVYCYVGRYRTAQGYQTQSLDIREEIDHKVGQADSLSRLGLLYHSLGDNRTTQRYCQLALAIQQKIGYRDGEGYSLTYLGHAQTGLEQLEAAATTYDQALCLRREMGQAGLAMDALAGLANVALKQGDLDAALTYVEEILAWLETNHVASLDNPFQVSLTAYRVLEATAPGNPAAIERAQAVLKAAHTALQERAVRLSDETQRYKFLENVKVHRDVVVAWEKTSDGT